MSQNSCPHLTQDIYLRKEDRGCTLHKSKTCMLQLCLERKPPPKIIQRTDSSTHLFYVWIMFGGARYSVSNCPRPTVHVVKTHVAGFSEGWFSTEKDPTGLLGAWDWFLEMNRSSLDAREFHGRFSSFLHGDKRALPRNHVKLLELDCNHMQSPYIMRIEIKLL